MAEGAIVTRQRPLADDLRLGAMRELFRRVAAGLAWGAEVGRRCKRERHAGARLTDETLHRIVADVERRHGAR